MYKRLPDEQIVLIFKTLYYFHKLLDPTSVTFYRFLHYIGHQVKVQSRSDGLTWIGAGHTASNGTAFRDSIELDTNEQILKFNWISDTTDGVHGRKGEWSRFSLCFELDFKRLSVSYNGNPCKTVVNSLHNPWEKAILKFGLLFGKALNVPFTQGHGPSLMNERTVRYVNH